MTRSHCFSYIFFKTFLDRFAAFCLLIVCAPILLIIAVAVGIGLGKPILFKQLRPGFRGRPFLILKFRTMHNSADCNGGLLPDAFRLNGFGRWLRASSLDELPGLINVLRGEMSFIGPRPLLPEYLPRYTTEQARRHDVKPGFSGWAQINGRNALPWEEKFRLDVWYVDHHSFWLDLRIFLITIWKVIRRKGISAVGEATMAPFSDTPAHQ